jgi:hypothetical protein
MRRPHSSPTPNESTARERTLSLLPAIGSHSHQTLKLGLAGSLGRENTTLSKSTSGSSPTGTSSAVNFIEIDWDPPLAFPFRDPGRRYVPCSETTTEASSRLQCCLARLTNSSLALEHNRPRYNEKDPAQARCKRATPSATMGHASPSCLRTQKKREFKNSCPDTPPSPHSGLSGLAFADLPETIHRNRQRLTPTISSIEGFTSRPYSVVS